MGKKGKILVYTKSFLPALGGLERNSHTLSQTLSNSGFDVTLLTETPGEIDINGPYRIVRTRSRIKFISEVSRVDKVIVNGGVALNIILPAILLFKRYYLIYQTANGYLRSNNTKAVKNRIRRYFAKKAIVNISVSEYGLELLSTLPTKSALLLNPIDEILEKVKAEIHPLQRNINQLLFSGRVIEGKGVFLLANALSILKEKYHLNVTLHIAGIGNDLEKLKVLAADRMLPIIFHDYVDRKELIQLYLTSTLLIVPSSTHVEGNPLVIAEALSCGLPVVVSDQPAMVHTIGNAGLVFRSDDVLDLADKIRDGLNLQRNHNLMRASKEMAKKFSMDQYRNSLLEIISTSHNA